MNEPDIVLKVVRPINEADGRTIGRSNTTGATDRGPNGIIGAYDWRMWNGAGFGQRLQNSLNNIGKGYFVEVSDMGQYVSVRAQYHNLATGKGASKTFIIVFDTPTKGDGRVWASSTKWRTISSVDQATNYIISSIRSAASRCETQS